jgi:hypothetical protein
MTWLALGALTGLLCLGAMLVAAGAVDLASGRYPTAVRTGGGLGWGRLRNGVVTWQAVYQTPDEMAAVLEWYSQRLSLPHSTTGQTDGSGCRMISVTALVYRLERTLAIVVCPRPPGTQVVVNQAARVLR